MLIGKLLARQFISVEDSKYSPQVETHYFDRSGGQLERPVLCESYFSSLA
jgi:hypothetical protein